MAGVLPDASDLGRLTRLAQASTTGGDGSWTGEPIVAVEREAAANRDRTVGDERESCSATDRQAVDVHLLRNHHPNGYPVGGGFDDG
jgi:hypothetical protein